MGKKSRLKRERRNAPPLTILGSGFERQRQTNDNFPHTLRSINKHLSQFNAEDVCIALNISGLWIRNISSQVKHSLAFHVFASMQTEQFDSTNKIDSYEDFRDFLSQLHALLPQLPMLEDYIPEADWGEVRIVYLGKISKLFFGCEIERITDFIECFKILIGDNAAALNDMRIALDIQNFTIEAIDKAIAGNAEGIERGHIEVPSEEFWRAARTMLRTNYDAVPSCIELSQGLIISHGSKDRSQSLSDFSELVMKGEILPALFIDIEGKRFPLSIRSMPGVVLTYWEKQAGETTTYPDAGTAKLIAEFLSKRIDYRNIVSGPFVVRSKTKQVPCVFSALLLSSNSFTFVLALHPQYMKLIQDIEMAIHEIIESGETWGVLVEGERDGIQFRNPSGRSPLINEVSILMVIAYSTTSFTRIELPETTARVMFLSDFVSIFDALQNVSELNRFWKYKEELGKSLSLMSMGLVDLFASFRDANGVLVDGALTFTHISIDPHWNTNWRFRELSEYWEIAPTIFPDDHERRWDISSAAEGLIRLNSRDMHSFAYLSIVNNCHIYCLFSFDNSALDAENSKLLDVFAHCISDSIHRIRDEIQYLPIFQNKCIATTFLPGQKYTTNDNADNEKRFQELLLEKWSTQLDHNTARISASVFVNLDRVQAKLHNASDASFEIECAISWVDGLGSALGSGLSIETINRLNQLSSRKPRFLLSKVARVYDSPDDCTPNVPRPEQYKLARRDLAQIFMELDVKPGNYKLHDAKVHIDAARDRYREKIHSRIRTYDNVTLLQYCIEQIDALTTSYDKSEIHFRKSLNHEVSYNRAEAFSDKHKEFTNNSKNYRYLLECCLYLQSKGLSDATPVAVAELIASVDWLVVLYSASDVLHNEIDVGGVIIDSSYIPEVFYSNDFVSKETDFDVENASAKLGIGLNAEDEVTSDHDFDKNIAALDVAFTTDTGFSLSHLLQLLTMLACWQSRLGKQDYRPYYKASRHELITTLQECIIDLSEEEANLLVLFAILEPTSVRRLLGKTTDEGDVPIWEHTKRGSRYTIRPLVPIDNSMYAWSAAAANKSFNIWWGSISSGYLTADFPWPNVKKTIRSIKAELEKRLEERAATICSRHTLFLVNGFDFKSKFPKENFDDVGDFDVLAYWPQTNLWVIIECKYNQPPFCLKDARRLRERIFGIHPDRGQFAKIERRRKFLGLQHSRLSSLLGWPNAATGTSVSFLEAYVSLTIYWWMRQPPYEVPTHFVRVDALDSWLRSNIPQSQADS